MDKTKVITAIFSFLVIALLVVALYLIMTAPKPNLIPVDYVDTPEQQTEVSEDFPVEETFSEEETSDMYYEPTDEYTQEESLPEESYPAESQQTEEPPQEDYYIEE
jgi:hypothetical protein